MEACECDSEEKQVIVSRECEKNLKSYVLASERPSDRVTREGWGHRNASGRAGEIAYATTLFCWQGCGIVGNRFLLQAIYQLMAHTLGELDSMCICRIGILLQNAGAVLACQEDGSYHAKLVFSQDQSRARPNRANTPSAQIACPSSRSQILREYCRCACVMEAKSRRSCLRFQEAIWNNRGLWTSVG